LQECTRIAGAGCSRAIAESSIFIASYSRSYKRPPLPVTTLNARESSVEVEFEELNIIGPNSTVNI